LLSVRRIECHQEAQQAQKDLFVPFCGYTH